MLAAYSIFAAEAPMLIPRAGLNRNAVQSFKDVRLDGFAKGVQEVLNLARLLANGIQRRRVICSIVAAGTAKLVLAT